MDPDDALQTIAEVSVALAGFASLIAVIRHDPQVGWSPRGLAGLRFMIELSLSAMIFSLLPFWLASLGISESLVWAWASGGLAMAIVVLMYLSLSRSVQLSRTGVRHRNPYQASFGLASGAVVVVILVLNALGVGISRGPSAYLFALIALLLSVANQFLNFVAGARANPPSETE